LTGIEETGAVYGPPPKLPNRGIEMAKDGKGMAAPIAVGGHYDASTAPKMKKGEFAQVGTFISEGDMTTVEPRGVSVNVKTGKTQVGNSEF
jgi:hypothetical protein